jgi:hypothetical protein
MISHPQDKLKVKYFSFPEFAKYDLKNTAFWVVMPCHYETS